MIFFFPKFLLSNVLTQDGYAVVAEDGPGEYPVVAEARAGNDALGVTVTPGTVAYVTTGGDFSFFFFSSMKDKRE